MMVRVLYTILDWAACCLLVKLVQFFHHGEEYMVLYSLMPTAVWFLGPKNSRMLPVNPLDLNYNYSLLSNTPSYLQQYKWLDR